MLFDDPALQKLKNSFESEKIKKDGYVKANEKGFGFLETDKESFFIAPNDMKMVLHGDRISAVIEEDHNNKKRAIPKTLIDPVLKRFVAKIMLVSGKLYVVPDVNGIRQKISATDKRIKDDRKFTHGDYVICTLKAHALKEGAFKAEINELICKGKDPTSPWLVCLRKYDLPIKEPDDEEFMLLDNESIYEGMTALPFITIDSEHTEDMDDALYIEKDGDNFILKVAIADPTGYIAPHSDLDVKAQKRAFSIYLPGRDIPMLPRVLSNNLCSLREGEERKALVGTFFINSAGIINTEQTSFRLATIKSQGKLIYNKVSDYLEGKNTDFVPSDAVKTVLALLSDFAKIREEYRATHAATFKNKPDYDFILNEKGALERIEVNFRRIANKIVEEAMITANIAAGYFLADKLHSGIFNIHKGFDLQKKKDIIELLKKEQCPFEKENLNTLESYNAIRRFAIANDNEYLDNRIRKYQEYTEISATPGPHYALGVNNYATWTSPIRKYGDMLNHRLIKSTLLADYNASKPDAAIAKSINEARKINRTVERDVKDWLYIDYLYPEIEKKTVFTAQIFEVTRGGIKVILQENGAMVFVPLSNLAKIRDDLNLYGDSGEIFVHNTCEKRIGDLIKIRISEINRDTRSIIGIVAESIGNLMLPEEKIRR